MGRLDVGIYGSAIFGVVPRVLAREPMLLALNDQHALAAREVIDVAALRDETLIVGMAPPWPPTPWNYAAATASSPALPHRPATSSWPRCWPPPAWA